MAGGNFTTPSQPMGDSNFNGGLNSTSGPLSLNNNESSNLLNIDFNKFGSIIKRNGYTALNTSVLGGIGGIDSYTKLLLHCNGTDASTTFTDSSLTGRTMTAVGSAQLDTAQQKFGIASGLFNGSSDYVTAVDSADWNFGTGDYTIDFWFRANNITTLHAICGQCTDTNNWWQVYITPSSMVLTLKTPTNPEDSVLATGLTISLNTWYHAAFVRSSGVNRIYLNGVNVTVTDNITTQDFVDKVDVLSVGASKRDASVYYYWNGWLDEFRLSTGIARWTTTFTPPTSEYSIGLSSLTSDGLWWYEYVSSGAYASLLLNVIGGKVFKNSGLTSTFTDATGTATVTAGNTCDFETWLNSAYITNNNDIPSFMVIGADAAPIPSFTANSYTFQVSGITTAPAAGDTYTNNAITYTITYVRVSGSAGAQAGQIVATGSGAPSTSGTLVRTAGSGDANITFTSVNANLTLSKAKCVRQYNNYLFLGNVVISGTTHKSRIYWSNIKDDLTWLSTSFIDISKDDGQQIVGMILLASSLIVFKERSIYVVDFTGDADVPFTLRRSDSNVGTVAQHSLQEVENGIVFLSYDGLYYFDGHNSYKISLQIQSTLLEYNSTRFYQGRSMKQKNKNRYFLSLPSSGQTNNDIIVVWDWQLNAFSLYSGIAASSMTTVYNSAIDERIYVGDYSGFVYRMDTGSDDYPSNVQTAINAYYYTNWKHFDDIVDQKGIPNIVVYYQTNNAVLTLVYSYDFENADTYTQTFSTATSTSVYGTAIYGTATYAGIGGAQQRRDLDGRGRVIRLGFKNSTLSETFQIDGIGSLVHLETNV